MFDFGPADVWTLFHSYAFDFSVWEIWGALLYGGRLVVVPWEISRSPEAFHELLLGEGVTVLNQTPSAFRQLLPFLERSGDGALRYVVFGGEALETGALGAWLDRGGRPPRAVNMYGITETTVHVTHRGLGADDLARRPGSGSPIGRPLPDLRVVLLDRDGNLAPAGAPGEIHVGGAGLMRGYLNRPELTAGRLVPSPFGGEPGARLYRAGDLARRLPTGELEFLGRVDSQVKIRGFRIELGEIEAALAGHPGIAASTVLLHRYGPGDERLVAYLVPDVDRAATARRMLRLAREEELGGRAPHELPNGMAVFHLNRSETEFVFDEIFTTASYLRHGITLDPGACVFDVGANIGLFSLFVAGLRGDARIYAFEPIPETFETLRLNASLHGLNAELFDCGLASEEKLVEFTCYPNASVLSGYLADPGEEREIVRAFLMQDPEAGLSRTEVDELLEERLTTRRVMRPLRRLSDVIRERGVERIDLLKIDVEKSELEVLGGIDQADWPKIRQVVVEVHDVDGRLDTVRSLLVRHGFSLACEQETALRRTGLYNLYATRAAAGPLAPPPVFEVPAGWRSASRLISEARDLVRRRLPDYMMPAAWVLLEALPLTPHGKIDLRALPLPEGARPEGEASFLAPRTPMEETLAALWSELLKIERVGIRDSFFDLGGHSLLATQLTTRVRSRFGVELPLRVLFESPRVESLARVVESLLAGESAREIPPLLRVPREGGLPLSFAQERLWFLDQLRPGLPTYNVPLALRLRGDFSPSAFAASLSAILARHEALRTTFATAGGRPVQVIGEPFRAAPAWIDLSGLPAGRREEVAQELAAAESARPFDLVRGPLLRATLLRLEDDSHVALLTLHHIVSDGWSLGVLVREMRELYTALVTGRPPALPELPAQYADFAVWQRAWLSGEVLEEQLGWWRERLAGAPALLDLPLDRPRPPAQSFRGARVPVRFPRELAGKIAAWSRERGATLFMVALAGFQALLSRISNQDDVVVGTPVANRGRFEIEGLIGFFANTLALRGRPEGDLAFSAWAGQVREAALGAYARQDLPFERIVEELQPERSLAHSPLFQVMLVLQNGAAEPLELPGLRLEPFASSGPAVAKFDLTLSLEETVDGGVAGSLDYGADLFDEATARRIAGALQTLLAAALEQPATALADLPLLSPAELVQALSAASTEVGPEIPPVCLHDLFAAQAARTPETVAAVHGSRQLTYRELDEASNRLARYLQHLGVGPEVRVGLCLDRSLQLLVGILGVLKAGGAWVPLDPGTPRERMATLLEDALGGLPGPLLLTEGEGIDGLSLPGLRMIRLEADAGEIARQETGPVSSGATPDSLAYVIFTSGSTGRPKGVAVAHRGLANLIAAQAGLFQVGPGSRVLQFASSGFDAVVAEIAVTLGTGATLHLAGREELMPGPDLARLLRERDISVVTLPPSALAVMPPEPFPALRTLVVAGEACPPATARSWAAGRRLVNAYGPTEATVCASAEVFGEPDERLTLGRPLPNVALYGLDARLRPVPAGVAGELCLAGPGLARGYLGRPDLTAEAFRPHPWSAEPGARLYRTGDAARRLPDGRFELLGRLDRQVKIRGFRVELGEIEAALESCPAVRQAAVVLREDGGEKLLAAYVVGEIAAAGLRSFLTERLPGYMIPALFVPLAEMPLLPSGKPDRKMLSRMPAGGAVEEGYAAPRTPIERALAGIFAETLRVERVGIRDDFFARGGHSLLAVGLVARIEERLGSRLPLATLFEGATVERLAGLLSKPLAVSESRALVAMQPRGSRPPLFCVHPIGGGVTGYYGHLMHHLGADQPFYGLQALELESREGGLEAAVEGIAGRYLAEVLAFRPHGPYLLGGASYGGLIAFEMARQLLDRGEEVALLALIDTTAPQAWSPEEGTPEEPPPLDDAEQSFGMARALARMYGKELDLSLDELRGRPLAEILERTLESVRAAGLAGPELDLAWVLGYRESFNARILGAIRYRAKAYPGRLVLFRSSDPGGHSPEGLARAYDWGALAREVEVRWVPGDHETMLLEPNVQELAITLGEFITAAAAGEPEIVGRTGAP